MKFKNGIKGEKNTFMTATFHSFEFIRKSKNRNVFDFSFTENLIILQEKYITH